VPAVQWRDLTRVSDGETSKIIRERVVTARGVQLERLRKFGIFSNAQMGPRLLKKICPLDQQSMSVLEKAIETLGLSARAYHRVLKIARTIADLDESLDISSSHVAEAIQYRSLDRRYH
jgi:magnesium chelatase family protein